MLRKIFLCSILAGALFGAPASFAPLSLRLEIVGAEGADVPVTVEIRRREENSLVQRLEATAPGSIQLSVPAEKDWSLHVRAPGYWSNSHSFSGVPKDVPIRVDLWRSTVISGTVVVPKGEPVPRTIALRMKSDSLRLEPQLAATNLACPILEDGSFRCTAPRMPSADLRFRVPGFASRFFWEVDLGREREFRVGKLVLRPGASVIGQVVAKARADVEDVVVELAPARRSPYSSADTEEKREEAPRAQPNRRGFFALEGLDPGVYRLTATHPDLATVERGPISVAAGAQTKIDSPIEMTMAQALRLSVEPQFDPGGGDWQLRISMSAAPLQSSTEPVLELETLAGFAETPGLALGIYEIEVSDSAGVLVMSERIEHSESIGLHPLIVDSVRVDGRVTLGGEPLVARIEFRKADFGRRVESDSEGEFRLSVPSQGNWDVQVQAEQPPVAWRDPEVEIVAEDGRFELLLELPDTRLIGLVVDEDRSPQAGAEVLVDTPVPVRQETNAEGRFEFYGLEEGTYRLGASLGERLASDPQRVDVREGAEAEVQLVLHEKEVLAGRFVDAGGNALPGLWLLSAAYSIAGERTPFRDLIDSTDEQGRFELWLGRHSAYVFLMALAPGIGTRSVALEPGNVGDISIQPGGGTLHLEVGSPVVWEGRFDELPGLTVPAGLRVPFGALLHWASLNGVPNEPTATRLSIPLLEPGVYRICWMGPADFNSRHSIGSGCESGELVPGGELTLRLGSPDES